MCIRDRFTGRYPESFFEFNVKYLRWNWRVNARLNNLCDGYPAFGLDAGDEYTEFHIDYPSAFSRGHTLVKGLFSFIYVLIPHGFVLFFRTLVGLVLQIVAFWVVMFTGNYPASIHEFNVGTMRWAMRVNLYILFMTDEYPPFSAAEYTNNSSQQPLDAIK